MSDPSATELDARIRELARKRAVLQPGHPATPPTDPALIGLLRADPVLVKLALIVHELLPRNVCRMVVPQARFPVLRWQPVDASPADLSVDEAHAPLGARSGPPVAGSSRGGGLTCG